MKLRPIILIIIILFTSKLFAQKQSFRRSSQKFEIVYLADGKYACNTIWLNKMRDDWKATGINLKIYRFAVERPDGSCNWNNGLYDVDEALRKITDAGLDIYLRVNLIAFLDNQILKNYGDDDVQIRSNGKRFNHVYDSHRRPIPNLTSLKARNDMLQFFQKVVSHLNSLPADIRNKIKLIVPSLTPDDETELPFDTYDDSAKTLVANELSGFSRPEIYGFMQFLKEKYHSIDSLDRSWGEGARFTDFDSSQIKIRNYNWNGLKYNPSASDYYKFENGRKDFLDFRRGELKKFIDDCSIIVRKAGFRFGAQFGSIYDSLVEFRGFYDPTPLIENVDELITDDILEYYPNYGFSADYSRSLCKYWMWKNRSKKKICFATEINWPGYAEHSPENLIKYWALQLRTFYEKGASCLFVSHWGTLDSPNEVPVKVLSGVLLPDYKAWQDTLSKFQNAPVKIVRSKLAYNLACEQGLCYQKKISPDNSGSYDFIHNEGLIVSNISGKNILEFPLNRYSKLTKVNEKIISAKNFDYVTGYMIQNSPKYIKKNYKKFYLNETSKFIPKTTKLNY